MGVRLESVWIRDWKSISDLELPLYPLTVLYGANGVGKSNVLEVLAFTEEKARSRIRRGYLQSSPAYGLVDYIFRYDGAEGRLAFWDHWIAKHVSLARPERPGVLSGQGLCQALIERDVYLQILSDCCGAPFFRLLEEFLDAPTVALSVGDEPRCHLIVRRRDLYNHHICYAEELRALVAEVRPESLSEKLDKAVGSSDSRDRMILHAKDTLSHLLEVLIGSRSPIISLADLTDPLISIMRKNSDPLWPAHELSQRIGDISVVWSDPSGLETDLEAALVDLHDMVWSIPSFHKDEENPLLYWLSAYSQSERENIVAPLKVSEDLVGFTDPWLEAIPASSGAASPPDGVRIRRTIPPVLELIERYSNEVRAPLVTGMIRLRFLPISVWGSVGKLEISVIENPGTAGGSRTIPFNMLGSGVQRWVAAAIRQACRDLTGGERILLSEQPGDDADAKPFGKGQEDYACDALRRQAEVGKLGALIRVEPSHSPMIVVIDEPEQHLHPKAQESLARWLAGQAELRDREQQGCAIVVATHSPAFLSLPPGSVGIVHVTKRGGRTEAMAFDEALLGALDRAASELRLDAVAASLDLGRAGLLQLLRAVIIVEGEWDVRVMVRFFGAELARERLLPLPLRGHEQYHALTDSHIVRRLSIPVIVFLDNILVEHITDSTLPEHRLSPEERTAKNIIKLFKREGVACDVVPFDEPDVVTALPECAVREWLRCGPDGPGTDEMFPGWGQLKRRWQEEASGQQKRSFKKFVAKTLLCHPGGPSNRAGLNQNQAIALFLEGVLSIAGDLRPSLSYRQAIARVVRLAKDLEIKYQ